MEFIVAQSSSPVGSTVRVHIENPKSIGVGGGSRFVTPITATVSQRLAIMGTVRKNKVSTKPPEILRVSVSAREQKKIRVSVKKSEFNAIIKDNRIKGVVK